MLTQEFKQDIKNRLTNLSKDELQEIQEFIFSLQQVVNGEEILTSPGSSLINQNDKNHLELKFYRLAENWKH